LYGLAKLGAYSNFSVIMPTKPVSIHATNTIMNEYFVGIDVQTKKDCSYAISDQNGYLKESGWFNNNHSYVIG